MSKRDYKKDAWLLHIEFHKELDSIRPVLKGSEVKNLDRLHDLFDNVILMIEKLYDQILKLEGALEEVRRRR